MEPRTQDRDFQLYVKKKKNKFNLPTANSSVTFFTTHSKWLSILMSEHILQAKHIKITNKYINENTKRPHR